MPSSSPVRTHLSETLAFSFLLPLAIWTVVAAPSPFCGKHCQKSSCREVPLFPAIQI
ncbi:hypothetical protein DEO72_LG2g2848 [Vigna unguiculata]|uniref:Uncharacterized protein n=1 Tax=Vigna unguiculata TaxID=3917 RepID=A0A4D6L1Z1_VIGUN|nr:hypothetical protein DEO72_LG2g2848 [Vigna unguiculata]